MHGYQGGEVGGGRNWEIGIDPCTLLIVVYVVAYFFVMSNSLWTHRLQHSRLLCPSLSPRVCSNSCTSHPLLAPSPPAFNFFQHQGLFKWVSSSHQMAKVLEFQLQHQSFQWTLRTNHLSDGCWISLQSRGLSRLFSNTRVQNHQFFDA